MTFQAGFGKQDMTCFIPGIGMMGYGQPHNTVKEIGTNLFARAMFLVDQKSKQQMVLVHLEQAFVTMAIKEEIVKRLQQSRPDWNMTDANVMITAQHTHAAPGGYSHYPLYNFTIPGFQLTVFNTVCNGIMRAIEEAHKNLTEMKIHWGKHTIGADKEVAYNRSMQAHLNNRDVAYVKMEESHLAVNREMEALFFTDNNGQVKAVFNWFGVHCTSISSFNHRIHHDNKGVAAALYEKNHPGTLAFFLQEAAGDVSPNFIWDKDLGRTRGKFKDQYENAEFNGEIQFREAEKILPKEQISGHLKYHHCFFDMAQEVAAPAHGVAFFTGTKEGPGLPQAIGNALKLVCRTLKKKQLLQHPELHTKFYAAQAPKDVLLDHRTGSFIGIPLSVWKKLPPIPDPAGEAFRKDAKNEAINTLPWVPAILPFQIIVLGPLLIAAVPGEITTQAARRLKDFIFKNAGPEVKKVIISSYANAYMGYVTTPEEYATQSYEAGHTVYGRETLRGFQRGFEGLLLELAGKPNPIPKASPFHFPLAELKRRTVKTDKPLL